MIRTRALLPYCLVSGSMSLGYGSIYTLLADLRDRFGFSGTQLGLIVASGFFAGFCAQLFLARYADRGHIALDGARWCDRRRPRDARQRRRHAVLGVPARAAAARPGQRHGEPRHSPDRHHPRPGPCGQQPRPPRLVRPGRLRPRPGGRRGHRRAVRHPRPLLDPRRRAVRGARAHVPHGPHRRSAERRAPRDPGAPQDPGHAGDPRGRRRVLRDRRHVRGGVGRAAARPWRRDLAHRPHPVVVHGPDDLPGADRRTRRAASGTPAASSPSA